MISLTAKQKEYWIKATHRWNIKSGATRSGKTYLDYYMIPKRIRSLHGKDGLVMLLGNTKTTLQRNIIEPLQGIWGAELVSDIKSDNTAFLFGEKVHCLGADKINQVDKLRGSGVKYCYGDEVVTWHEDVFTMLKSRLDKPYSCFDGTCNPSFPQHWFKSFIDSDADIFSQEYTIYDNDFLDSRVVEALEREFAGTVFFDRYIMGKWTLAEGLIYQIFADKEDSFYISAEDLPKDLGYVNIGVDFGGNKSKHAFVASAITDNKVFVLKSRCLNASGMSVDTLIYEFVKFTEEIEKEFKTKIDYVFADNEESAIINTMAVKTKYNVRGCLKNRIMDRIVCENILLNSDRLKLVRGENETIADGLRNARWNDKKMQDERLDDGTSNIDILDAFEYSWELFIKRLLRG